TSGAVLLTVLSSTAHCATLLTTLGHAARNGPSLPTAGSLAHSSGRPRLPTNHPLAPSPTASAIWQSRPRLHSLH
ncbi:hypothetical protein F5888DRAFT_1742996, partial [Russula emetica]